MVLSRSVAPLSQHTSAEDAGEAISLIPRPDVGRSSLSGGPRPFRHAPSVDISGGRLAPIHSRVQAAAVDSEGRRFAARSHSCIWLCPGPRDNTSVSSALYGFLFLPSAYRTHLLSLLLLCLRSAWTVRRGGALGQQRWSGMCDDSVEFVVCAGVLFFDGGGFNLRSLRAYRRCDCGGFVDCVVVRRDRGRRASANVPFRARS